ncbi:hypothetical protein C8R43DRAFT_1117299 [Mycena crocata]|nr:hypothetical protein C8R43DRAFT_1117299 [Mycena crocata]
MSQLNIRMKKKWNPSTHNVQTLGEEVEAVGAALDKTIGDTMGGDDGAGEVQAQHPIKRLEMSYISNDVVDNSAVVRLEMSHEVNSAVDNSAANMAGIVDDARGELPLYKLPGVDRNALRVDYAPRIRRYKLEEYMDEFQNQFNEDTKDNSTDIDTILAPVISWDNEWTVATNRKGLKTEGGKDYINPKKELTTQPKFFPDWFDSSDDEDVSETTYEDSNMAVIHKVPVLPEYQPIDLSILEGILEDMSDDEDILELLSEYYQPANKSSEDMQIQAAIIESLKDPKAKHLGAERRAGSSTVKLGAVIVEINSDTEATADSPMANVSGKAKSASGQQSKGKNVDTAEKGPDYDRLHHTAWHAKTGKTDQKTEKKAAKAKGNHLKPQHFKRDQSEIPDGGWFRATTVGPDGPPSPPSLSSSSSSDTDSDSDSSSSDNQMKNLAPQRIPNQAQG